MDKRFPLGNGSSSIWLGKVIRATAPPPKAKISWKRVSGGLWQFSVSLRHDQATYVWAWTDKKGATDELKDILRRGISREEIIAPRGIKERLLEGIEQWNEA